MNLRLLPAFVLTAFPVLADTLPVLPGESIQAQIDVANPGDIIAIFGGTYDQDVIVNKVVRLAEVSGQDVTITGTVTFSGVVDPPPFEGFTVGSANKGIVAHNTTKLLLRDIQSTAGFGLQTTGTTRVIVEGSSLSAVAADSIQVELADTSIVGDVVQNSGSFHARQTLIGGELQAVGTSVETVCFRVSVGDVVDISSLRAWFGYSTARGLSFSGANSKAWIIASTIDRAGSRRDGISLKGTSNSYVIANCVVKGVGWYRNSEGNGIGCSGDGHSISVFNNWIDLTYDGGGLPAPGGNGIRIFGDPAICRILSNIVTGAQYGISAPFGVSARANTYWDFPYSQFRESGGVAAQGTLYQDPRFVVGDEPTLRPNSPCINSGVNDPIFNDLDGSSNDRGPSGGCWFDPDGWTTEKPVVISFDLAPEQLLEGVDTTVTISNGQAAAQP